MCDRTIERGVVGCTAGAHRLIAMTPSSFARSPPSTPFLGRNDLGTHAGLGCRSPGVNDSERGPVDRPTQTRRDRLASPATAAVVCAIAIAFGAAALILCIIDHKVSSAGPILIPTTMFGAVGVVVARRQPRNPIGWLLIFVALLENMFVFATAYLVFSHWLGHGLGALPRAALWFENSFWDLGLIVGLPALLLFPNGSIPSRRWRTTLRIYVVAAVLVVAPQCVAATILVRWHNLQIDASGNPIGSPSISGFVAFEGSGLAVMVLVPLLASWVVRQVTAFRRSSGILRQQLKWSTPGALVLVISIAVEVPLSDLGTSAEVNVLNDVATAMFGAFPLGMGLGILRYRLYDIDRLISRTLSYTVMTGLLIGVYVGIVVLATNVLSFSSPVAVTASTLVAAALFNPLRRGSQRMVDRRFNRSGYDAETTVAAFSARLRDAVDLETVRVDLLAVVKHAVEPAHASIWISPARAGRAGSP